jgi:isopenicillin N synthase-like dioxygenase
MTSSRFQSPTHRVVLPKRGQTDRSSFVFFYYPNFNAEFNSKVPLRRSELEAGSAESELMVAEVTDAMGENVNTMLDLAVANPELRDVPFGEYIMRKWGGVLRKAPSDV